MSGDGHEVRTHHRIIIAQCTDDKRSGQHRAVDLYEPSRLFRAQRRYAEAYADKWFILSAKYGLIHPTQLVSYYDMEISEQYSEQWQEALDNKIERITRGDIHVEVIAGGDYLERLEWYLDHYDVDYSVPFEGQRYAIRIQDMVEAAREVENHSLEAFA